MVEKKVEKGGKKGGKSGGYLQNLTKAEQEVLFLITKEFLTIRQIIIRRQTKKSAVYKIVKNLRKKGVLTQQNTMVEKIGCTIPPFAENSAFSGSHGVRLHGVELSVSILSADFRYKKALKDANLKYVEGNTVKLYNNSIEVYLTKSWVRSDAERAWVDCVGYLQRFFIILENDLKIILVKHRSENIKVVKWHFAELNNELARDCEVSGDKIRLFAEEDGKLWFTIDKSLNVNEAETQHPETAKRDMQKVIYPLFTDLRKNPDTPVPSELHKMIMSVASNQALTLSVQDAYAEQIRRHLVVQEKTLENMDKMGATMNGMAEYMRDVRDLVKDVKEKDSRLEKARLLRKEWGW